MKLFPTQQYFTIIIYKIQTLEHSNKIITLIWILEHCNIQGNQETDRHAKNAVTITEILFPCPF